MEGKEVRFGIALDRCSPVITTAASCGAVNAMHDSFTPLGGLVPLVMIQLGEVIFGGVGSGLYGMLVFAVLAVFVAGLMVGRTPEYLGKKIEAHEMKMAMIAILVCRCILGFTALAVMTERSAARASRTRARTASPRCCTPTRRRQQQRLGLRRSHRPTRPSTTLRAAAMLDRPLRRHRPAWRWPGSLAARSVPPSTEGTLPTHGPLFVGC
jgi:K+-transporting ATPase ATPase A chain